MEAFKWNEAAKGWHLFEALAGTHCYLQQIQAPVIPETNRRSTEMSYIYIVVEAVIQENSTWTLRASPFSNVYDALGYCEERLGYIPKFRDPQEDIYYATKEKE